MASARTAVLRLYNEADQGIPVRDVKEMEAALGAAGKTAEFTLYPGAPHTFHADYRPSYRPEAAKDAWMRCVALFNKYLKDYAGTAHNIGRRAFPFFGTPSKYPTPSAIRYWPLVMASGDVRYSGIATTGSGGLNKYPWTSSHAHSCRYVICSRVSTPSASTRIPR